MIASHWMYRQHFELFESDIKRLILFGCSKNDWCGYSHSSFQRQLLKSPIRRCISDWEWSFNDIQYRWIYKDINKASVPLLIVFIAWIFHDASKNFNFDFIQTYSRLIYTRIYEIEFILWNTYSIDWNYFCWIHFIKYPYNKMSFRGLKLSYFTRTET